MNDKFQPRTPSINDEFQPRAPSAHTETHGTATQGFRFCRTVSPFLCAAKPPVVKREFEKCER